MPIGFRLDSLILFEKPFGEDFIFGFAVPLVVQMNELSLGMLKLKAPRMLNFASSKTLVSLVC